MTHDESRIPAPLGRGVVKEQTIAIVGTAGRKDDAQKLYPEMFTAMGAQLTLSWGSLNSERWGRE